MSDPGLGDTSSRFGSCMEFLTSGFLLLQSWLWRLGPQISVAWNAIAGYAQRCMDIVSEACDFFCEGCPGGVSPKSFKVDAPLQESEIDGLVD
mmetsp:Transcript_16906/g.34851  ORF Transcript_16906/g.34851 Transcript_16906/m.34851 type:complete len:93 (-) Transcript_16906:77-355(-)